LVSISTKVAATAAAAPRNRFAPADFGGPRDARSLLVGARTADRPETRATRVRCSAIFVSTYASLTATAWRISTAARVSVPPIDTIGFSM
jgi:hypothetical protein